MRAAGVRDHRFFPEDDSDRSFDPVRLIIRCLTAIVPRVAGRFDAGKAALRK
ncbi:hypothetical protein [Burkholderia sp. Se-20378]|uniref:hypothetical protein n=1 Tax=Burkholderia sp. Se-20378 TaxID=2703899 RepID=UPI00197F3D06|nr:hypothetical protein [Burkholderia sp. Se-20378]MBN3774362.1 hypothetical protein [Burkholderia sp. Se-20378]